MYMKWKQEIVNLHRAKLGKGHWYLCHEDLEVRATAVAMVLTQEPWSWQLKALVV